MQLFKLFSEKLRPIKTGVFTDEVFVASLTSPHVAFGPVRTLVDVFPAADDNVDDLSSRMSMTKL